MARIATVPCARHAAGALYDRDQRHDVEGLQAWFHEVDEAEGEKAIIIAVAAETAEARGAAQRLEAIALGAGREEVGLVQAKASFSATPLRLWIRFVAPPWRRNAARSSLKKRSPVKGWSMRPSGVRNRA